MKELSDKERTLRDRRTRALFICFLVVPGRPNELILHEAFLDCNVLPSRTAGKLLKIFEVLFVGLDSMTLV